jgi:hypothetical protein
MTLPLDRMAAPGVPSQLIVTAEFDDNRFDGVDRIGDLTPRSFDVKARLSKQPRDQDDMLADIEPSQGSSFFALAPGKSHIEFAIGNVVLRLDANARRELSMATSSIWATRALDARLIFEASLSRCFDHLSYLHAVPIFVSLVTVRDAVNEVQYTYIQSPPRAVPLDTNETTLHAEMAPVYALYRESQNSASPYYRVLCLYKIMEGLLDPMQVSARERAKVAGIALEARKAIVPNHNDIAPWLKPHVGAPMKIFFDNFLTKQHRDAVAHFELESKAALNVSSPPDGELFAHVAFLADLCARLLIERHEQILAQLPIARTSGT